MQFKLEIIHIAQQHRPGYGTETWSQSDWELCKAMVVESQFKVAKAIKQYPKCYPVVVEGFHSAAFLGKETREKIKATFPQGLPDTLQELSEAQKDMLWEHEGADILYSLGDIMSTLPADDRLDKVLPEVNSNPIYKKNPELASARVHAETPRREKQAIAQAIKAAVISKELQDLYNLNSKIQPLRVLLVFGARHDFASYGGQSLLKDNNIVKISISRIDCDATDIYHAIDRHHATEIHQEPTWLQVIPLKHMFIGGIIALTLAISLAVILCASWSMPFVLAAASLIESLTVPGCIACGVYSFFVGAMMGLTYHACCTANTSTPPNDPPGGEIKREEGAVVSVANHRFFNTEASQPTQFPRTIQNSSCL